MKKQTKSRANKNRWNELSLKLRKDVHCELCDIKEHLQVHHITSKFYMKSKLRFAKENLVVVCPKHHFMFHKSPVQTMEWFKRNRPDDYDYVLRELGELGAL